MSKERGGDIQSVDASLESTLDSVDVAEADALRVAGEIGFDEDDLNKIGMAVRETMVNAVVHGNRYSAKKRVQFRVWKGEGRLTILVGDEGEGFELSDLPDPLADENLLRQSGRGLLLIQAFMDEVRVERGHPHGTVVTMVKTLTKES